MTVSELKNYLNYIKDDSIEVKIKVGSIESSLDELTCIIKNTKKVELQVNGETICTYTNPNTSLILTNASYEEDKIECKLKSIHTVARLNGDVVSVNGR